jgi:uncharacterized protein YsxB (DUF464 family)
VKRSLKIALLALMNLFFIACEESDNDLQLLEITARVQKIADQYGELGFDISLDQLKIELKSKEELASSFNALSNNSRKDVVQSNPFSSSVVKGVNGINLENFSGRLAFYDTGKGIMSIQRDAGALLTDSYLAHELAHAYQDQKWGFKNILHDYQINYSREQFNITEFMIEGHAEIMREGYDFSVANGAGEKLKLANNISKITQNNCVACDAGSSSNSMAYDLGLRFFAHQYSKNGWSKVEDLILNPPSSTEQILHPKKLSNDLPQIIDLPPWQDKNFPSQKTFSGSMGEGFLLSRLMSLGATKKESFLAASGWDGDVAQIYQTNNGSEVLIWRIIFDREKDVSQIIDTLKKIKAPGKTIRLGKTIDWVMSDNPQLTDGLIVFLSKQIITPTSNALDESSTDEQEAQGLTDFISPKVLPDSGALFMIGPKEF